MHDTDCTHRFVFENYPIRGHLVHLDASWRALLEHRDYPTEIRDTLGEAVVAAVLLAATVKFDGQLTLQMQGEGPMHLLLAQCTSNLNVRGLARYRDAIASRDVAKLSGDGRLTVTIESEDLQQRYQGIVPVAGARLSQAIENYFAQSEQLPTRLWLHADAHGASGMLLQRLPDASVGGEPERAEVLDDAWRRVQLIGDTLKPEELRTLSDREILRRLFNEDDVRLFESVPVSFRCRCSRERVSSMLRSLGTAELDSVLTEQGKVEVHCDFCNRAYLFDAVDVAQLFVGPSAEGSLRKH